MLIPMTFALLTLVAPVETDTVIPVGRGERLNVENFRGEVVIGTWDRSAIRVEADLSSRHRLAVSRSGTVVRVRPEGAHGSHGEADLRITIPSWMDVRVSGNQLDVAVRGTRGEVDIENIGGDILVDGGAGAVSVRTIQGEIRIRNAQGRIEAVAVNDDIELTGVAGDVDVQATNGDITLRGLRSTAARATTVNGDIVYDGTIRDNGKYAFSTHNGDITVTAPQNANATVSVTTYHGEFESDFPVRLTGTTRDRQFNFTLGSGSARIELESFNGRIRLRRP